MIKPRTTSRIRHYFQMHRYFRSSRLSLMTYEEDRHDTIPAEPLTEPRNEKPEVE